MKKLAGIKEGDTVEVSFRASVKTVSPLGFSVFVEGGLYYTGFSCIDIASPSFTIRKVDPPLAVGDRVVRKDVPLSARSLMDHLRVIDIDREHAVIQAWNRTRDQRSGHSYGVVRVSDLERA